MKKLSQIILSIIFIAAIQSCKKDSKNDSKNVEVVDSLPHAEVEEISEELEKKEPTEPNVTFPKTGNKVADFLPKLNIYEVQYEANGDLNNDGLDDIAIVLKHKESNILKRPMLILLQNEDKSYRLDKMSDVVIPVEYNDYDFKLYDTENIKIENGELKIDLYSYGSSGTFLSKFKYVENDLILYYMETYFRGAGEQSGLFYDFEKGEVTSTDTNTMKEDAPTTSKTTKVKMTPHLFEKTSITDFYN